MKRTILIAVILGLVAYAAFALDMDFGVNLDTSTFLSSGVIDTTYYSQYKAALWGEMFQATDHGGSLDLIAQGSYRYTAERPYIFDLDLFRFDGLFSEAFGAGTAVELKAGRFEFADATRLILDQTLDGVQVSFLFTGFQVRLGAAYSGLILNPSSNVRISDDDFAEVDNNSIFFGPKRLITQLFAGSDAIALEALAQFDLRGSGATEIINTQYLELAGTPRLVSGLYLDYNLTGSFGQSTRAAQTTYLVSGLAGLGLRYFNQDLANSQAHLKVTYATGFTPVVLLLKNISVTNFLPMTPPTIGLVFSPPLSNILYADFGYSFRPFSGNSSVILSNLQPEVGARVFFRDPFPYLATGTAANLLVTDLNPSSNALYLGTEVTAGIVARPFADLGLSVEGGAFIPSAGGDNAFTSDRGIGYVLKIDISAAL